MLYGIRSPIASVRLASWRLLRQSKLFYAETFPCPFCYTVFLCSNEHIIEKCEMFSFDRDLFFNRANASPSDFISCFFESCNDEIVIALADFSKAVLAAWDKFDIFLAEKLYGV